MPSCISAYSDNSAYVTGVSVETPGKPGGQLYFYRAYVLAVWVGIFMMGDVISESAPSMSAAIRTSTYSARSYSDMSDVQANC